MSTEVASGTRTKLSTRSTFRQTLNFSSMGKAIADVMSKDSDKEKAVKKAKDARRSSLLAPTRSSTEKQNYSRQDEERGLPLDNKTITKHSRRLSSATKVDTTPSESRSSSPSSAINPKCTIPPRASTLRPKGVLNASSLPKYRPKSLIVDTVTSRKPPSPSGMSPETHSSSCSDDDYVNIDPMATIRLEIPFPRDRETSISSHRHKGALKVNLSSAIHISPSTPEKTVKGSISTPLSSPARHRTTPDRSNASKPISSSPTGRTVIPRPSSSASSSSSVHGIQSPKTPKTLRGVFGVSGASNKPKTPREARAESPLRTKVLSAPDSPSARLSARKKSNTAVPTPSEATPTLPTILTGDSSFDSVEANDVEFLLGSMASPTAPTPYLPRLRTWGISPSGDDAPSTPSRQTSFLPSRANLSYLSPAPPTSDNSPFLRPINQRMGNNRGSILSWEQLAQSQRSVDGEEVTHMLYDVQAPFGSCAPSPAPSTLPDIPESPSSCSLPSPTGYGSISQVLLPDVTPSPAIHNGQRFAQLEPETDSSTMTYLRLQLASAESSTREQLSRIQMLEEQLQRSKEARLRDAEELARQISALEEQVTENLGKENDRAQYTATLEEALAHAHLATENVVKEALKEAHGAALIAQRTALREHEKRCNLSAVASSAVAAWKDARSAAEGELELVRSNRMMLSVLLAGLVPLQEQLTCSA